MLVTFTLILQRSLPWQVAATTLTHSLSPRAANSPKGLFRSFRKRIRLIQTIDFTNPGEPRIVRSRDAPRTDAIITAECARKANCMTASCNWYFLRG
ncbi:hypothetical protein MPL3365_170072 [Mesorhizobium plurifarium]|uniref:Uncharacterized protein n=1 Tax=Mesorhizobium plurifarium TaxID=69974 RepID=A0A090G5F1_MESPL|nr:hypothetical protein MPL3365_170072 [Mesorhizobium plurifarium]